MESNFVLGNKVTIGIDTSNYTTSVAAVEEGGCILADLRIQIETPSGMRGIRQSEALFQHWRNLPSLLEEVLKSAGGPVNVGAVSVSDVPEPREGSYMPVFTAGAGAGKILADALRVPLYSASHQEGHFAAAALGHKIDFSKPVIAAHLSGGTASLVVISKGTMETVGGSRDITYGQLLDRCGHALGLGFPAGAALDSAALSFPGLRNGYNGGTFQNPLCKINREGLHVNLSGIETQVLRWAEDIKKRGNSAPDGIDEVYGGIEGKAGAIDSGGVYGGIADITAEDDGSVCGNTGDDSSACGSGVCGEGCDSELCDEVKFLAAALLDRIASSIEDLLKEAERRFSARQILLSGGVGASGYLRKRLGRDGVFFASPELSCDNAIGTAILRGRKLWDLTL